MALTLYDLAGEDLDRRFSPFCWRIKLALAHKGLGAETVPWRFTETDRLAFSGQGLVPVLVDGDKVVSDSWNIACYLEDAYPDRPSLFGGAGGRAMAHFITAWTDGVLHPLVARCVVRDILDVIRPEDRAYFRESRERRFGTTLEAWVADREQHVLALRAALNPLRFTLGKQEFLGGATPNYADYTIFGAFMWARNTSPFRLLAADDPVHAWRARLLAAFDGLAGRSLGYDV